jgi:hypothetical protein
MAMTRLTAQDPLVTLVANLVTSAVLGGMLQGGESRF